MAFNADKFVETYQSVEEHRKLRNRWAALGAGGIAVGAIVALATGHYDIGGLIAVGSTLGVEPMVLEAQSVVTDHRRRLGYMIEENIPTEIVEEGLAT